MVRPRRGAGDLDSNTAALAAALLDGHAGNIVLTHASQGSCSMAVASSAPGAFAATQCTNPACTHAACADAMCIGAADDEAGEPRRRHRSQTWLRRRRRGAAAVVDDFRSVCCSLHLPEAPRHDDPSSRARWPSRSPPEARSRRRR